MRAVMLALACATLAPPSAMLPAAPNAVPHVSFHHLHLNDARPASLAAFYVRLFDPSVVSRTMVGDMEVLRAGTTLLHISPAPVVEERQTALWHFGWGDASLGETYLAHARREVAWEPPLPPNSLHFHLRSVTPATAARWYADNLGAEITLATAHGDSLPAPEHRTPEALVQLGSTALLIYRAAPPMFSTRGQRADHVAVAVGDIEGTVSFLRDNDVIVLREPSFDGNTRAAMIQGPDQIAIELVELPK